jgi:hypothetical protein
VDCNHFQAGRVAALRYRFDAVRGLYEWVETGPFIETGGAAIGEASIAPLADGGWLIAARGPGSAAWVRADDPFRPMPPARFGARPAIQQQLTLYTCADGVVRLFTGDVGTSPYGHGRNPLYCWDVDPATGGVSGCRTVFDCVAGGVLPNTAMPRAEMCKLLPHMGGRQQYLLWRVRSKNVGHPYGGLPPVTPEMKAAHGLYGAMITYDRDCAAAWVFGPDTWSAGSVPTP